MAGIPTTSTTLLNDLACDTQHASVATGTILSGWRIVAFLGRGGSTEVYRAVHVSLPLQSAVKVLVRTEASQIERFRRETAFLSGLRLPALPRFFDSGEVEGRPYMIMEFLEPLDLPRKDKPIARFLTSVAECVKALHSRGIIHRNLKPQSIMRRRDGSLVIINLGYAERGSPLLQTSDMKALGMLADECFAGKAPFCWTRIIRRCSSSIPFMRYQTADDFIRAIKHRHWLRNTMIAVVAFVVCAIAALSQLKLMEPVHVVPEAPSAPVEEEPPVVERLSGNGATLKSFLAVCRTLGKTDWMRTLPPPMISPMEILMRENRPARQRASAIRKKA